MCEKNILRSGLEFIAAQIGRRPKLSRRLIFNVRFGLMRNLTGWQNVGCVIFMREIQIYSERSALEK